RFACRCLGHAHLRQLRVGIGDPGKRLVVNPSGQPEGEVPDDDPGVIARDMGELRAARGIAHGEDAWVRTAQPAIEDEAAPLIALDPSLLKVEASEIGAPAGRYQ